MEEGNEKKVEEQFIKACEDHTDSLFRYCYFKISNRDLAKDLVQETFTRTWNYLTQGHEVLNFKAFFYRTLSNLIIDEYRKNKPLSLDKLHEAGFDPEMVGEVKSIEDKIDGARALDILKRVGGMYEEVIYLKYVEDLSLKEIAEITKDSENAVGVKIHRGLKKIRKMFN